MIEDELGGPQAQAVVESMARRLHSARGVLITSHVQPDGDALGSELALALGLEALGKRVVVANSDPCPKKYDFLDPQRRVVVHATPTGPDDYRDLDLGVLLDTSEPERAGRVQPALLAGWRPRICLDHHVARPSPLFHDHWIAEASPSAATLVLRLLDVLSVPIDAAIALGLFVGLATDTGWFRYSNTGALALRDAARLRETGLDLEDLYRRIYEEFSSERLRVQGRFAASHRLEMDGRFAWSLIDRAMLDEAGLPAEELDGVSGDLRTIRGVAITATILEPQSGKLKVSLRSRGRVSVEGVARSFGGGGHSKAAGFRYEGNLDALLALLRPRIAAALPPR